MSEAEEIRKPSVNNETASNVAFLKEQVRYRDWKSGQEPYQDRPFVPDEAIYLKAVFGVGVAE